MTNPILHTVFRNFSTHQSLRAPEGMLLLIKLVSTPYNIHGNDSMELFCVPKESTSQARLGSLLALNISRDLAHLYREYDADADRLHKVFQEAGAVLLSDAHVHLDSIYMRSPIDLDTTYALVSDKGERLVLLKMKDGLAHIGPDQVEIYVRRALAKQGALPSGYETLRHPVYETLSRYMQPVPQDKILR